MPFWRAGGIDQKFKIRCSLGSLFWMEAGGGEGLQLYQADCVPPPLLSLGRILVGNPLRCVCGLLWLQSWQQKRQLDWAGNQSFQCLQEDRTLVPVLNLTLSGCGKAELPPQWGTPSRNSVDLSSFLHGCSSSPSRIFLASFTAARESLSSLGGGVWQLPEAPTLPLHPCADFPKVRIDYNPTPMGEGESVNLTCHITGEPQPVADWDLPKVGGEPPIKTKASCGGSRPGTDLKNAPAG